LEESPLDDVGIRFPGEVENEDEVEVEDVVGF
jgi:hypothetical protein